MRLKIYILTFHRTNNYGAALQAFALFSYLSRTGADVHIIDYDPDTLAYNYHLPPLLTGPVAGIAKNFLLRGYYKKSRQFMNRFNSEYLRFTPRCATREDVQALPPCNLYIVGSDQVWNPRITKEDETFFLPFPLGGRKIAYAASAGSKEIPPTFWEKAGGYLRDFDGISAREDTLCQFLRENGFTDCQHLLDPVFLLEPDAYKKIAIPPTCKQPYVFFYEMAMDPTLAETAKTLARRHGYQVLQCNRVNNRYHVDKLCPPLGPREFLGLMEGAEYVVTNSFHGVSLSIILSKQFFTRRLNTYGTRIESLLKLLGLMDRMIDTEQEVVSAADIDYIGVRERLRIARSEAKRFLHSYL